MSEGGAKPTHSYQRLETVNSSWQEGLALLQEGCFLEAEQRIKQVFNFNPNYLQPRLLCRHSIIATRRPREVVTLLQPLLNKVENLSPQEHGEVLHYWASAMAELGDPQQACSHFAVAAHLIPHCFQLHYNWAVAALRACYPEAAIVQARQALACKAHSAEALTILGMALRDAGRADEALEAFEAAQIIDPCCPSLITNLLITLNCLPSLSSYQIACRHRELAALLTPPTVQPVCRPRLASRSLRKRIAVGYLSADFRLHSAAFFLQAPLDAHDRRIVQVHNLASVVYPDRMTAHFIQQARAHGDGWHDISRLNDAAVVALIEELGIDVLVDLGGHTEHNRLGVFTHRPAYARVSWLGYPHATGLEAIMARISDHYADPLNISAADGDVIRLPRCFLAYSPPEQMPDMTALPADRSRQVTFASFHALGKLAGETLDLWAEVMKAVPESRLIIKASGLADSYVRARLIAAFDARDIISERLDLRPSLPLLSAHLASYAEIDIMLDVPHYNGTTISCESLWMGVPVITLCGERHASRVGASLLHAVGVPEWIAEDKSDFIARACALAEDWPTRRAFRRDARAMLARSPLADGAELAQALEEVYRDLLIKQAEIQ